MKRSPIKKVNAERRSRLFRRQFLSGDFVQYVKALPCEKCGGSPCDVHHEPPRSRGATWRDVIPLCLECHFVRHQVGEATFWQGHDLVGAKSKVQEGWDLTR